MAVRHFHNISPAPLCHFAPFPVPPAPLWVLQLQPTIELKAWIRDPVMTTIIRRVLCINCAKLLGEVLLKLQVFLCEAREWWVSVTIRYILSLLRYMRLKNDFGERLFEWKSNLLFQIPTWDLFYFLKYNQKFLTSLKKKQTPSASLRNKVSLWRLVGFNDKF